LKRQSEIEDKLDLAKNQAATQAEAISSEKNKETMSTQERKKPRYERGKKVGIRF
jgi:hypothetical protein